MTTKLTLPCVFDVDGLEKAIRLIPELSTSEVELEFVFRQNGSDIRYGRVRDLQTMVNSWLRRRAKDYGLDRSKRKGKE